MTNTIDCSILPASLSLYDGHLKDARSNSTLAVQKGKARSGKRAPEL